MEILVTTNERGVEIVRPNVNRLDSAVAPLFKAEVLKLINEGNKRLVLDLSNVDFMDSSGLGSMVSVLKALGGTGSLAVCNIKGSVLSLFKLTRMDKVFSIHGSVDEAVNSAAG